MVYGGKWLIFRFGRPARRIFFAAWVALASSCAQTFVQPIADNMTKNHPAPTRILVYDFAVDNSQISEYQGIMRQQPSVRNPQERQRALGKNVGDELTVNLISGLRRMGFTVERAPRGMVPGKNDLAIDGRVLIVDEGNPLRRLAIGFGSGAARLATQVRITGMSEQRELLEFSVRAESGRVPGAVVTLPVGAALPTGLGLGVAAGSSVAKAANENSSNVNHLAVSSAAHTLRYLSDFFARKGWIDPATLSKPRVHS